MRIGVIAKKVGMTRLFQEDGRHVPVTVQASREARWWWNTGDGLSNACPAPGWVTTVTSLPRRDQTEPSSRPMAPPPTTTSFFGTESKAIA